MITDWPTRWAAQDFCHVTTTGRQTGRPHTIEIWFAAHGGRLYLLSEHADRTDWVQNLRAQPAVRVRLGDETREGIARVVDNPAEATLARRLIAAKYEGWQEGAPLRAWVQAALPVAIEVRAAD